MHLPTLNALLNVATTVCLVSGYLAIRRRDKIQHQRWMLGACLFGASFLTSYIYYHVTVTEPTRFQGVGMVRSLYFSILISHTVLAALVLPAALTVLTLALRKNFERHKVWARWCLPTWLYVSVTGVVIYAMLYL